jgi:hypothetical protein
MKKLLLVLTLLITCLKANPIDPTEFFINEVLIDDSTWVIELPNKFTYTSETLFDYLQDTLIIRTYQDSLYYPVKKIEFGEKFCCLTSDSIDDFIYLNPDHQFLQLEMKDTSVFSYHSELTWGSDSPPLVYPKIPGIAKNASLSRENDNLMSPEFLLKYYLDFSPTIGSKNDSLDATGKLVISVTDSCSRPMPAEIIGLGIWETNFIGEKEYTLLASYYNISIKPKNNSNINDWQQVDIFIYPDSTQYINVVFPIRYTAVEKTLKTSDSYSLSQNYPNPFNPTTTFTYKIPNPSFVKLKVFDLKGNLVSNLVSEVLAPGTYHKRWIASGHPSGIYIYQLETSAGILQKKCLLVK